MPDLAFNIQPFVFCLTISATGHGHQEAAQKKVDSAEEKQRLAERARQGMKKRARAKKEKETQESNKANESKSSSSW